MRIELCEEAKHGRDTMFYIAINGETVKWFCKKEEAERYYEDVINDPELIKPVTKILKSQEVFVSSEQK
ncbi:hypothetical protein EBS02_12340 [bacterium]|nr:hypothetical protein [bacterium]